MGDLNGSRVHQNTVANQFAWQVTKEGLLSNHSDGVSRGSKWTEELVRKSKEILLAPVLLP